MAATTPTSDLDLAARLRLSVTRLARRLRQETGQELTPSQASALASIERHGPLTPSELASLERVQRPTATRILAGLLEADLIMRERDEADGRVARVSVTREGSALLKRRRSRKNAYLARRFSRLTPEELEILDRAAAVLERLIEDDEERGR